jgi:hypothetical protein
MKTILSVCLYCLLIQQVSAQTSIKDESIAYQQERMVYKQWDKNKFTPTSGFLGLNPYYWLTWGLMPGYKNSDLRPMSASGPQTQRLGLVGTMSSVDENYRKEADTLRNTSASEIANQAGAISEADPLWLLYYSKELKPVLNFSEATVLGPLPVKVREKVVGEGFYNWYAKEVQMLAERLNGARTANMDRGARITAYHRMLLEYRTLAATWATRVSSVVMTMQMTAGQKTVKSNQVPIERWTPDADVRIARAVLQARKY